MLVFTFKQPLPSVCLKIIFPLALCLFIYLDYKTDAIIQATLRHQMSSDVTIITVAHRLQTIMDADKIVCSIYLFVLLFTEHEA